MPPGDVVQPGVVALADERDDDVVLAADAGELLDHPLHRRVGDGAHAERVGEEDGRLDEAPLHELRQPRHLARAVQDEAAPDHALLEDVARVGRIAVTPVRTGPLPTSARRRPRMMVE